MFQSSYGNMTEPTQIFNYQTLFFAYWNRKAVEIRACETEFVFTLVKAIF